MSAPNIPRLPITAKCIEYLSSAILRLVKQTEGKMSFTPLGIEGSWVFTPKQLPDDRGSFHEVFKLPQVTEALGFGFEVKQVNQSRSAAGVIRGIHWADVPPGQAKYVFCPKGSIWDVVVDIRLGSPTFGKFDAVEINASNGKSVLIKEGLGHVFLSLEDDTVVNYLCSETFNPTSEHGLNPLDSEIAIPFDSMLPDVSFAISTKDMGAPSFTQAKEAKILPVFKN
jgi:dTDP-4-dehydrorhamnose 3,5-epimerase